MPDFRLGPTSRLAVSGDFLPGPLLQLIALAGNLSVHGIGCEINLTGPCDCTVVDKDLLEEPLSRSGARTAVSPSGRAVFESDKEAVVRFWFYFNYVPIH